MTGFAPELFSPRVSVRDVAENALGQLETFTEADFVTKWNGVGSWRIKAASNVPGVEHITAGCGISAVMPDGYRFTGQVTDLVKSRNRDERGAGTLEVSGVEDNAILGFRLAFPTPSQPANLQTASATYNATGIAETVMRALVAANMGPSAGQSARRITNLRLEADQGRGSTIALSLRFDNLLEVHQRTLSPIGLGFSIKAEPGGYVYSISQARDLSLDVVYSEEKGNLDGWQYALKSPGLTKAIVAGQGEGTARNILEVNDPTIPSLETTWGFRIEQFVDRRDTNVTLELQQAAADSFGQQNNQFALTIDPVDTDDVKFGRDVFLGDIVSAKVDGTLYSDTITQVAYQFRPGSYRPVPTIGNADAVGGRALDLYRVVRLIASRIGLLEKRF
jgi:hypothetical protein